MTPATYVEALTVAAAKAAEAHTRAHQALVDIVTAETPLSALAAAGNAVEHEATARRWQAVAAKLRASS